MTIFFMLSKALFSWFIKVYHSLAKNGSRRLGSPASLRFLSAASFSKGTMAFPMNSCTASGILPSLFSWCSCSKIGFISDIWAIFALFNIHISWLQRSKESCEMMSFISESPSTELGCSLLSMFPSSSCFASRAIASSACFSCCSHNSIKSRFSFPSSPGNISSRELTRGFILFILRVLTQGIKAILLNFS